MSESGNDNSFKSSVASDMDTDSCKVPLPADAPISSHSSDNPSQATAIRSLVIALKSDLELDSAFEDAMLVTSRREFLQQHALLLRDFLINIQLKKAEWREAVEFFSKKPIVRRIAEEICNSSSANSTLLRNAEETSESPSEFDRLQPPIKLGIMPPTMGLEVKHSADQHESNDVSENIDPGYGGNFDAIDVLQPDKMVRSLIDDECFSQYKSSFQDFVHQNCSPHTLRFVIRLGNVDALRGIIERHFDAVATGEFEWLQELESLGYNSRGMAELLVDDMNESPWIYFSEPTPIDDTILPGFHVFNCIHQGGKKVDLAPKLITEPLENQEDIKRLVAEHCGLAAVIPRSRTTTEWIGVVAFSGENQDTASISYNVPGSWNQLISRACGALRRFCGIASYLQKKCLWCNSFTVLRYTSEYSPVAIELRNVEFRIASDLFKALQLVLNNFENPELTSRCLPLLTRLANDVIRIVCDDHTFAIDDVLDFKDCLDRVSLAAQILTLGIYLCSQAHTGSVYPFCLMNPLSHIYLFDSQSPVEDSNLAHVQVSLSSLGCMASVMEDRVTVFGSCHPSELRSSAKNYDLYGCREGLAGIWEVWRFMKDGRASHGEDISVVAIRNGRITCSRVIQHSTDLCIAVPKFPWSKGIEALGSATPFSLHSKALIGTATEDPSCPIDVVGTPEKYFLGKTITSNNPPRLNISTSMIPERLQARINERIREKQCTDARAHGLVVLAKT